MYDDTNKCPVCKSKRHTSIRATGSEYANLVSCDCGTIRLKACVDCGAVYIDDFDRQQCLRRFESKKRTRK